MNARKRACTPLNLFLCPPNASLYASTARPAGCAPPSVHEQDARQVGRKSGRGTGGCANRGWQMRGSWDSCGGIIIFTYKLAVAIFGVRRLPSSLNYTRCSYSQVFCCLLHLTYTKIVRRHPASWPSKSARTLRRFSSMLGMYIHTPMSFQSEGKKHRRFSLTCPPTYTKTCSQEPDPTTNARAVPIYATTVSSATERCFERHRLIRE